MINTVFNKNHTATTFYLQVSRRGQNRREVRCERVCSSTSCFCVSINRIFSHLSRHHPSGREQYSKNRHLQASIALFRVSCPACSWGRGSWDPHFSPDMGKWTGFSPLYHTLSEPCGWSRPAGQRRRNVPPRGWSAESVQRTFKEGVETND